jgi:hypothetical protein
MTRFTPEMEAVRWRNGTVTAVGAGTATVTMDGASLTVPVLGTAPSVGAKVMVLEQGAARLLLSSDYATKGYVDNGWTAWQYPALLNGWQAYDGRTVRYKKSRDGRVVIEGVVKNTVFNSSPVFAMPVGFRPTRGNVDFVVSCSGGSVIFSLGPGGETTIVNPNPVTANPAGYTYLNATYSVEA